jgi:hypothetical protein
MAVIGEFMANDHAINSNAKVIQILYTRCDDMPLLTEVLVEIGLWTREPGINDDVEPGVGGRGVRELEEPGRLHRGTGSVLGAPGAWGVHLRLGAAVLGPVGASSWGWRSNSVGRRGGDGIRGHPHMWGGQEGQPGSSENVPGGSDGQVQGIGRTKIE